MLALALTAESLLRADAYQMGILGALHTASFLLLGLGVGVAVDRIPRRRMLIVTDLGRGLLLATIPLAVFYSTLTLTHLYVVAFLAGVLTAFFDVAYQAYLPSLVSKEQLTSANSKLEVSRNIAQLTGPAIAGALIRLLSAPVTIIIDCLSYLLSALFLLGIKETEEEKLPPPGRSVVSDIREGLGVVLGNPILRAIALTTSSLNFFWMIQNSIFILILRRNLGYDELAIGVLFGLGGAGGLLGALACARVTKFFGIGPTIILGAFVFGLASFALPLASIFPASAYPVLIFGQMLQAFSIVIYDINQVSLRQSITPNHLQGRMNATMKFFIMGSLPIGGFIGGYWGSRFGLEVTLLAGAIGSVTSFLWVAISPLVTPERGPESGPGEC